MARRTKEDALTTRHHLLDAAEVLFQLRGVSRTSLNDIAKQAGASRGAIYWHFQDKADLFNAMMERVTLPLEQAFQNIGLALESPPLEQIRQAMHHALHRIATDDQTRRVLEVATQKVEYIDELQAVRSRHIRVRSEFLAHVEQGLNRSAESQALSLPVPPAIAAQGLHALVDGLIQNWLLDPHAFDLIDEGHKVVNVYLTGLGFKLTVDLTQA